MNGRKAKQRRRAHPDKLHPRDATRIATATHEAICATTGTDGFGFCALYAWVGAVAARVLTGRVYDLQAGRVLVGTGDVNDDGELHLDIHPDGGALTVGPFAGRPGGRGNGEYHAWFAARPHAATGAAVGTVVAGDPATAEVADLSLRHFPAHARTSGLPWLRSDLPAFYWGSFKGLDGLRVRLTPDAATTNLVTEMLNGLDPIPADAARHAVRLLGAGKAPAPVL